MEVKAGYLTPMLHVQSVERSIQFYELLGFTTVDTEGCEGEPLGWARMHCEAGAVMFLRAEEPMTAPTPQVIFALYTPDLLALRAKLLASGVDVPEIKFPPYLPAGEIGLRDPDGWLLSLIHWSQVEHDAWLKKIAKTAAESASSER